MTSDLATPIPAHVDDITVDWLNQVLRPNEEFGTIESIEIEHFGEGVGILGELGRIAITYAAGEGGPATIVAKCQSPSPENQFLSETMGFYLREVNFYRHVADHVDLRVPAPYYVDASDTGVPFVLLIEDIEGATNPDQISGITVGQVKQILSTVIPLHVRYWGSADLHELHWLPPMNNDLYKGGKALGDALWPGFVERFGDRVSDEMLGTLRSAIDRYPEMLDYQVSIGTQTFTHTDCRAENYLFGSSPTGEDEITVVDFQLSTKHWGIWDLANLIGGSMEPELRRAHEEELVEWYVGEINAGGITDYTVEQATLEYRFCLLHQSIAAVMVSDLQGGNARGVELLEQLFLRPIHAATDNEVGELLDHF